MRQIKNLLYALLPFTMFAFISCSEDLETLENNNVVREGKFYKTLEITANCAYDDPTTRAVLENDRTVNWEDVDKLYIWTGEAKDGGNYTVSKANLGEFTRTTKNGVNTFYGYLRDTELDSEPADDTPLYAYVASEFIEPVYVISNVQSNWSEETGYIYETTSFLCVDLSEQKGTMEDAMKHDLLWATLPYSDFKNNEIPNVQFQHEMSILKYTLTLEGAGNTTADIRLSGFGMANKVNFKINTGKGNGVSRISILNHCSYDMVLGDIMLKNVEVKNDVATVYVALYPSWFTEMQAFVTLADGKKATASVGGNFNEYPIEYTLEAGKIYTASATVEPVTVTAKVGDFYNSDGTCTVAAQNNSIGIVFSTETSARDFADGYTNGYVMTLENTHEGKGFDTKREAIYVVRGKSPSTLYSAWYYNRDGRYQTALEMQFREANGEDRCIAPYSACSYMPNGGYTPPMGSSGWFLPSTGQFWNIMTNLGKLSFTDIEYNDPVYDVPSNFAQNTSLLDKRITFGGFSVYWSSDLFININSLLEKAANQAGVTVETFDNLEDIDPWVWTSDEQTQSGVGIATPKGIGMRTVKTNQAFVNFCVRPVLAF